MLLFLKFLQNIGFTVALIMATLLTLDYTLHPPYMAPFIPMYGSWPAVIALSFALLMGHWRGALEKPADLTTAVRYVIWCGLVLAVLTLAMVLPPPALRTPGYYTVLFLGLGFLLLLLAFTHALFSRLEKSNKPVASGS